MDKKEADNTAPQPASLVVYRRIAVVFLGLTAIVVALVFYVVFAKAKVVVMSEQQELQADFIIDVAREPLAGEVKGTVLELTDAVTRPFPTTSVVKVAVPVEGRVRISSSLSRAQTLVATTRLLTEDEVLYRIKDTIVVPAHGSVEVDAFSTGSGEEYAIGDATFTIPGLNPSTRRLFTVETVEPLTGGYYEVRMVTQSDVDIAAEILKEELSAKLIDTIRREAEDAGIPTSGEVVKVEVLDQEADVEIGAETERFQLTVRGRVVATFYDKSVLRDLVGDRLADALPYDRILLQVNDDRTRVEIEKYDLLAGRTNLRVSASGVSVMSPQAPYLDPERLAGISVAAAQEYLESVEGVSSASIKTSPIWSRRMPNLSEHITVEVR